MYGHDLFFDNRSPCVCSALFAARVRIITAFLTILDIHVFFTCVNITFVIMIMQDIILALAILLAIRILAHRRRSHSNCHPHGHHLLLWP